MAANPEPLPAGAVLGERFRLESVLGRGGFGIAYLAEDLLRHDRVVLKELAPPGSVRNSEGFLDLDGVGATTAHRLRSRFLEEAKILGRLNLRGIPNVRAYASEAGTAYYVSDFISDARPLDEVLRAEVRLPVAKTLDILQQLIETLEAVHARGVLHRDIKPSNVLLTGEGRAFLIDFGAAREWHADMTEHHTVLFTPGYAPLEQLSEKARRGPATDVYGLSALGYTLLTGRAPTTATDRMNGVPLQPILELRPEVEPTLARALEAGLGLRYEHRPPTLADLRDLMERDGQELEHPTLARLDELLVQLQALSPSRRECPACRELMTTPKPLKLGRCPVCTRGMIRPRAIDARLCSVCKSGVLKLVLNTGPLAICPICAVGPLIRHKEKWFGRDFFYRCARCEAMLKEEGKVVALQSPPNEGDGVNDRPRNARAWDARTGEAKTWEEWRVGSKRSSRVHRCDGCHAQFDECPDGQWAQIDPVPEPRSLAKLYPEDWARVAAGFEPGCGTHACNVCEADYFVEGDRVTLLGAHEDPFGFAERQVGRLLTWEWITWLGVGRESPRQGPTCLNCHTEFDAEGEYLRLVRSDHPVLRHRLDELQTLEDWHRLARELPLTHDESAFLEQLNEAVVSAFHAGTVDLDDRGTYWKGPAERLAPTEASGTLTATPDELTFGGLLRRDHIAFETLAKVTVEGDQLCLWLKGEREPAVFEVEELEFTAHLRSGNRTVTLGAEDLAARLTAGIASSLVTR